YGGGGCWDAETCNPDSKTYIYASTIEPNRHPDQLNGIFDLDHPENPVAGYSMVAIPVCTGDAYLGDRDATYTLETESGDKQTFTIHHRGQTNTMAVMDWILDNFESPREIFVTGSSAGGVGTPFYANFLARHYPSARVVGLGDDAGSWGITGTGGADPGQWGIPDVLQPHPGWEKFDDSLRVEHLYMTAARNTPNLRLYQFDHAHDEKQGFYLKLTGAEDTDVLRYLRANRQSIREQVPEFRSFIVGGFAHTVLLDKRFYNYQTDGHRLSDWVAAIVAGEPVTSVDCGDDCLRPGLVYNEEDLQIVERVIELLSAPDVWNQEDKGGNCPKKAKRYSLRCATVQAVRDVTGQTPGGLRNLPSAAWDVIYTATDRLEHRGRGDVVRWFNNHEDTKVEDVIALLEEVRDRIRKNLSNR
ncbi:MAG: pectin acetylesterase-family hydrolase, partial [Flavobacteriaceae bacterium]